MTSLQGFFFFFLTTEGLTKLVLSSSPSPPHTHPFIEEKLSLNLGIGPTQMTEQKGNAKEILVLPLPGQACKSDKTKLPFERVGVGVLHSPNRR